MLEELWKTEADLHHHIGSEEYRNLLLVLEMALKQPEIRFDTISSSKGIETVEKARSHGRWISGYSGVRQETGVIWKGLQQEDVNKAELL